MSVFINEKKFISNIENPDTPLLYYILSFLSFIAIENFLEIFSDTASVSFSLFPFNSPLYLSANASIFISFLHFSLWWVAVVLAFPIIFSWVTKENIEKTLRAVFAFSWLLVLTPIFDLVVSKGKGIDIHYIKPKGILDLPAIVKGLTPGENLTAIAALTLSFIYCLIKSKNKKIIRATLATLSTGVFVCLAFILTYLIANLAIIAKMPVCKIHPLMLIRLFLIVIFAELVIIFYLRDRAYFSRLIKDVKGLYVLNFVLAFLFGILLVRNRVGEFILHNPGCFLLSIITIMLGWITVVSINNLGAYKNTAAGIFLFAGLCAVSINVTTLYALIIACGCGIIYCLWPMKLKRIPIFSKIIISSNILLLVILGWLFAGREIQSFPHIFSLYFLVFYTVSLNFLDFKDYLTDKQNNSPTLPVIFGERVSKFFIGLAILAAYLVVPLLFLEKTILVQSLFLGVAQFYLINRRNYNESMVLTVHLIGFINLLIWLSYLQPFL